MARFQVRTIDGDIQRLDIEDIDEPRTLVRHAQDKGLLVGTDTSLVQAEVAIPYHAVASVRRA